ncbi:MAG: polysaccharide deacetylase family protein [Pontibacterium sp.]
MLKNLIIEAFGYGSIPKLLQRLLKRNGVSILAYHSIVETPLPFGDWCFLDVTEFEKQIAYLSKHFKIVHIDEAVEALQADNIKTPLAVITFDDGYRNNLTKALPILQKYNAPATIYLVTEKIATHQALWFSYLIQAFEKTKKNQITWNNHFYSLATQEDKKKACTSIQQEIKWMNGERTIEAIQNIAKLLKVELEWTVEDNSAHSILNISDIKALQKSGLITFGAHSHDHTVLAQLSKEQQQAQIHRSKACIESITGTPCEHFAYPNGGSGDFSQTTVSLLKDNGFRTAVTMLTGNNIDLTYPYHLNRYGIGSDTAFSRFKLWVHNIR